VLLPLLFQTLRTLGSYPCHHHHHSFSSTLPSFSDSKHIVVVLSLGKPINNVLNLDAKFGRL
jgi:hypothetical protein